MSKSNVKVVVRIRPVLGKERNIKRVITKNNKVYLAQKRRNVYGKDIQKITEYKFDKTYQGPGQHLLHNDIGREVVNCTMKHNVNCCVFAYGQTGSGKTYTMLGKVKDDKVHYSAASLFEAYRPLFHIFPVELIAHIHKFMGYNDLSKRGLIPRICEDLFAQLKSNYQRNNHLFQVYVRFVEIYNSKTRDLLVKGSQFGKCTSATQNAIKVKNVERVNVKSYKEILKLLKNGLKRRITKATKGNEVSSRSHAIFTIFCRVYSRDDVRRFKERKIHLVDLAGSEKYAKKKYSKARQKEGNFINLSLLELGRCLGIAVENSTKRRKNYIPVRSSILTHLLEDSLGGNSKVFMIGNVSPCQKDVCESMSTLTYCHNSKKIKLNVKENAEEDWSLKLKHFCVELCDCSVRKDEYQIKWERIRRRKKKINYMNTRDYRMYLRMGTLINMSGKKITQFLYKKIDQFDKEIVNDVLVDCMYYVASMFEEQHVLLLLNKIDRAFGASFWNFGELDEIRGV